MSVRTLVTSRDLAPGECLAFDLGIGEVVACSARAPYKSDDEPNEDNLAVFRLGDDSHVLVIADGVGGSPAGEVASGLVISRLETRLAELDDDTLVTATLIAALEEVHEEVKATVSVGASTVAIVYIEAGTFRTLHVGDSVVMQCGQRGKLKLETIAHSPVGYALEAGVLSEDEAFTHEDRHVVSNIVGGQEMSIALGAVMSVDPRDTLLVATDGVTDNLRQGEIIEMVRKGKLISCGMQLAEGAQQRMREEGGKPDDMTFILFRRKAQK